MSQVSPTLVRLPTIYMAEERETYHDVSGPIAIRGILPDERNNLPARAVLATQLGEFVIDMPGLELATKLNELRTPGSKIKILERDQPKKD